VTGHLGGSHVWLRSKPGLEGDIDLRDGIRGEAFEPPKNVAEFSKLRAHPELQAFVWPAGAEFFAKVAVGAGRGGEGRA
jgi:hypothetical protein